MLDTWKGWARVLKRQVHTLYLAYRDPRVPWHARLVVGLVVAYAFSPIDLIPDFVPVLGYLDDLLLVPLGVALAVRLLPAVVLADCRAEAERAIATGKPVNRAAAVAIVTSWVLLAAAGIWLPARRLR